MKYSVIALILGLFVMLLGCAKKKKSNSAVPLPTSVTDKTLLQLIDAPPRIVAWAELGDMDQVDQRRMCVEMIQGTIIGVLDGVVEFSPDHSPPTPDEILCWIWFIRPDLADQIAPKANKPLSDLMQSHKNGTLDNWWGQFPK